MSALTGFWQNAGKKSVLGFVLKILASTDHRDRIGGLVNLRFHLQGLLCCLSL